LDDIYDARSPTDPFLNSSLINSEVATSSEIETSLLSSFYSSSLSSKLESVLSESEIKHSIGFFYIFTLSNNPAPLITLAFAIILFVSSGNKC